MSWIITPSGSISFDVVHNGTMGRGRKRRLTAETDDGVLCPLCGQPFDLNEGVGLPGQLREGETTADCADQAILLDLSGLPVMAIVAADGAPLRDDGYQVLFYLCSRQCEAAVRMGAGLDVLADTGAFPDPLAAGVVGLRRMDPKAGVTEARVDRMDQFDAMLREHLPAVAKRIGADRPAPTTIDDLSEAEIQKATDQLRTRCGWCLCEIADDTPIEVAFLTLDVSDDDDWPGGIRSIVVGDRIVAVQRIHPDSPAAAEGNALIVLCGLGCAKHLKEAAASESGSRGPIN